MPHAARRPRSWLIFDVRQKMEPVLTLVFGLLGAAMVISFFASFAAHVALQFYIDHERIKKELGELGWKVLGSMQASTGFYKPETAWLWKIRRRGFIGFFIGGGVTILVALIAAAFR